jgi:energy-coupling factor transporter ATP-binding protein EcfA2
MFVEAVEGVSAAVSIYEQRKSIARSLRRLLRLATKGNVHVAVFGPGGCGKTTLGALLAGALDTAVKAKSYAETGANEVFKTASDIPTKVTVTPGQPHRRPRNWDQIYAQIAKGETTRVVNLISWGYHSTELEKERIFPGRTFKNNQEFREAYLSENRQREIAALQEIAPHLKSAPDRLHMITLVNKQDLWWDRRRQAEQFVTEGEYAALIEDIRRYKGAAGFQHDIVSAAFVQQNLMTLDGFQLASTVAGYDDIRRMANLNRAVLALEQMIGQ